MDGGLSARGGRTRTRRAFTLHVLNKTDHALWLTGQFGKWLEAAKESYEKEQQLHETNKELRAMSPAELDRPENRERVAQQAAAENAKAARLDGLTQSGRHLVEQATKNDEFDAKRLESWATMLKILQDIAANRMPSVAELLKQTANAPGSPGSHTQPQPQTPVAAPPSERAGRRRRRRALRRGKAQRGAAAPRGRSTRTLHRSRRRRVYRTRSRDISSSSRRRRRRPGRRRRPEAASCGCRM